MASFATSYIPTTSATATRSADVASISGSNFSSWYRQDEGTVFARFTSFNPATVGIAGFDDGTNDNRWRIGKSSSSEGQLIVQNGGSNQVTNVVSGVNVNSMGSVAAAIRLNDSSSTANGAAPLADESCVIPVVNKMTIGSAQVITSAGSVIRRIAYWPQRLSNNVLQEITR